MRDMKNLHERFSYCFKFLRLGNNNNNNKRLSEKDKALIKTGIYSRISFSKD